MKSNKFKKSIAIVSVLMIAGVGYLIYFNSTSQIVRRLGVSDAVAHSQKPEYSSAVSKSYRQKTNGHTTSGELTNQLGKTCTYIAGYDNDFKLTTLVFDVMKDNPRFVVGDFSTMIAIGESIDD